MMDFLMESCLMCIKQIDLEQAELYTSQVVK